MSRETDELPEFLGQYSASHLLKSLVSLQAESAALRAEIDELRDAQSLLEGARDDYAELHDLAPVALLTLGRDGRVRSANLAAAELLEEERGALIQRQLRSFVHEQDRSRLAAYLGQPSRGPGGAADVRLVLPNGNVAPIRLWARASWRHPGVQHLTVLDLREQAREPWEPQQVLDTTRRVFGRLQSDIVPRRRILVVEHHAATAEALGNLLEDRGYRVITATSLAEAKCVDFSHIDGVISALGLPDGSGFDLLRDLPGSADQPAIALGGSGMPGEQRHAAQLGFDLYLAKPIDFEQLLDGLAELLARPLSAAREARG